MAKGQSRSAPIGLDQGTKSSSSTLHSKSKAERTKARHKASHTRFAALAPKHGAVESHLTGTGKQAFSARAYPLPTRNASRTNDQRLWPSSRNTEEEIILSEDRSSRLISSPSPEPLLNILGTVGGDPFDVSPLPSERHSRELVSLYVGTDCFTTAVVHGSMPGRRFETQMRRERWFPLAIKSRAGYAGLIAYLETGQSNPLGKQTELYRRHYLSIGLQELTEALKDPHKVLEDETVFAVLMFMVVALQLRDFESVRFHAQGLYRLVYQRAIAAGEDAPLVQYRASPRFEDTGVPALVRHGHITHRMGDILRCNLILSQFTSAFSRDYVAGYGTGHHVWKTADFPRDMNQIELAIMDAYRIYIRRVATKNPLNLAPQVLTSALKHRLQHCDTNKIWATVPYLLMWMALIAGPAVEDDTFEFFVWVLKETQARTFTWSFQEATQKISQLFFWSPVLNKATEQFWDRIISTSEMPAPYETPSTLGGSDEATNALERPLTLQGTVALRGPRRSPSSS